MKTIYLIRTEQTNKYVLGQLNYGITFLQTLELPYRDNQKNISCIPPGHYRISIRYSPGFKRKVLMLNDVPGRKYIYFHAANMVSQLRGCIAVGLDLDFRNNMPFLLNARKAENLLFRQVEKDIIKGNKVYVLIEELKSCFLNKKKGEKDEERNQND